jgi:ASPIC and UnbV
VRSGGSFCSQNDLSLFFGLGASEQADSVQVFWPNGRVDALTKVTGGRCLMLKEGQGVKGVEEFRPQPRLERQ